MATFEASDDGRRVTLGEEMTIGRSSLCFWVIAHDSISRDHARIWWRDQCWWIRDLNSRNGTRVDGKALGADDVMLSEGCLLQFGDEENSWTFVHAGPPLAAALAPNGERVCEQPEGLALGADSDAPSVIVYSKPDGQWVAEANDGSLRAVVDGETIDVDGVGHKLELPPHGPGAALTQIQSANVSALVLTFQVSSDEEEVCITLVDGTGERQLPPRASNYFLLHLARLRVADQRAGEPEDECGWIDTQLLAKQLGVLETVLNVDIHRIRKRFGEAGVRDAANLIERRKGSRKLRIGVSSLRVESG